MIKAIDRTSAHVVDCDGVRVTVLVDIDIERLVRLLACRALATKKGKCSLQNHMIEVRVIERDPPEKV